MDLSRREWLSVPWQRAGMREVRETRQKLFPDAANMAALTGVMPTTQADTINSDLLTFLKR